MSAGELDATTRSAIEASAVDEVVVRIVEGDDVQAFAKRFGPELDEVLDAGGVHFAARARLALANLRDEDGKPVRFEPLERGKRWVLTLLDAPPFFVVEQRVAVTQYRAPHDVA